MNFTCLRSAVWLLQKGGLGELIAAARKTLPLVNVPVAPLLAPVLPPACPVAKVCCMDTLISSKI